MREIRVLKVAFIGSSFSCVSEFYFSWFSRLWEDLFLSFSLLRFVFLLSLFCIFLRTFVYVTDFVLVCLFSRRNFFWLRKFVEIFYLRFLFSCVLPEKSRGSRDFRRNFRMWIPFGKQSRHLHCQWERLFSRKKKKKNTETEWDTKFLTFHFAFHRTNDIHLPWCFCEKMYWSPRIGTLLSCLPIPYHIVVSIEPKSSGSFAGCIALENSRVEAIVRYVNCNEEETGFQDDFCKLSSSFVDERKEIGTLFLLDSSHSYTYVFLPLKIVSFFIHLIFFLLSEFVPVYSCIVRNWELCIRFLVQTRERLKFVLIKGRVFNKNENLVFYLFESLNVALLSKKPLSKKSIFAASLTFVVDFFVLLHERPCFHAAHAIGMIVMTIGLQSTNR